MLIAKQKRKENIAEYLLYMWQIEDIVRSFKCDIDALNKYIVAQFPVEQQAQELEWFQGIVTMMQLEDKKTSGHLQVNINVLLQLAELHQELLKSDKFPEYAAEFYRTLPIIVDLRARSQGSQVGELETCFNALYGTLLLKLQGKEISEGTIKAMAQISKFVAMLSALFKKNEETPLFEEPEV
ncbi:MAG: DUF4924 family protein [Muribaculaceae bacterium]